jgi:hypothetical protein
MGEYAQYGKDRIKIGTCEEMYYLRADQVHMVQPLEGNVDPVRDRNEIRFRFPWPDEDNVAPGAFDKYERAVTFHGVPIPVEVVHQSVQFSAPGYVLSLPCPESEGIRHVKVDGEALHVGRNGYTGGAQLVQQRYWDDKLVIVAKCGGCGAKYRVETLEGAQPYIKACLDEGARNGAREWWTEIARRIEAGYSGTEKDEA